MNHTFNMSNYWACSECGEWAYYDGRCGDPPVLLCGCDQKGPVIEDSRSGSISQYYPAATAQPIKVGPNYRSPSQKRNSV